MGLWKASGPVGYQRCPRCSGEVFVPGGEAVSYRVDGVREKRGEAVRCARCMLVFAVGDFGVLEPRVGEKAEASGPEAKPVPAGHVGERLVGDADIVRMFGARKP